MNGKRIFDHVDPYLAPPERDAPEPPADPVTREMISLGARALGGYTAENGYTDEDWQAAGDAYELRERAERVLRAALSEEQA